MTNSFIRWKLLDLNNKCQCTDCLTRGIDTQKTEIINNPSHYDHPTGVKCYEIVEHFPYHIATAMAYLWRENKKNGIEDIKKAIKHLEMELVKREKYG